MVGTAARRSLNRLNWIVVAQFAQVATAPVNNANLIVALREIVSLAQLQLAENARLGGKLAVAWDEAVDQDTDGGFLNFEELSFEHLPVVSHQFLLLALAQFFEGALLDVTGGVAELTQHSVLDELAATFPHLLEAGRDSVAETRRKEIL